MPEIIVYTGVIGSGKDYQSKLLVERGYRHLNFADALRDMMSDLLGYDIRTDYDWFKEYAVGIKRPKNRLLEAYAIEDSRKAVALGVPTGRIMLQRLGTEVMRKRDSNYWADKWMDSAETMLTHGWNLVCSDCRFGNEVDRVINIGGKATFVFCNYHSERYDAAMDHESEYLAQALLQRGIKDLAEIPLENLGAAITDMENRIKEKESITS